METDVLVKTTLENAKRLNLISDVAAPYDEITAGFAQMPKEILDNMDRFCIVGMVLTHIGLGKTEYDNGAYTPSQDKIYAFDVEVFPLERMYARFIDGITSIMAEEVLFTNVTEDTSGVEWNNSTGTWVLRFACNGTPYEFAAKMNNDWFDTDIIGFINAILEEQGAEKRLLVTGDGMQTCILFYNEEKWKDEYAQIMGYELDCPLSKT